MKSLLVVVLKFPLYLYCIEGIINKYIHNSILENQIIPFVDENIPLQWMFQQDNDPIESLWKQLDKVRLHGKFRNAEELYQELQTTWPQIKQAQIDKLIESMPHR